ncbi:capsule biosynthesis GfcC D2 domain-containing protein [Psychromonas sp.]|uniref:capsule biosynthesis GfcC D2 domain-containing protein n=1 Tax=Psychromonas sp. TaxID=1884585 RepID=UPI003A969ECE
MKRVFTAIVLCSCLLLSLISSYSAAQETKITLLQDQIALLYPQEVRFSQVLTDAYSHTKNNVYSLGIALLAPDKQHLIDSKKHVILSKLRSINTPDASNLATQLESLPFAYREHLETDPSKVRVNPKFDPMIKGEYWLSLPKRPDHITLIDPSTNRNVKVALKTDNNLKDYLAELAGKHAYDSAWIIQANQDTYLATDIQWKDKLYFLSPGAIVFIGITNLPDQYSDLNADIARLLAFHLEL